MAWNGRSRQGGKVFVYILEIFRDFWNLGIYSGAHSGNIRINPFTALYVYYSNTEIVSTVLLNMRDFVYRAWQWHFKTSTHVQIMWKFANM